MESLTQSLLASADAQVIALRNAYVKSVIEAAPRNTTAPKSEPQVPKDTKPAYKDETPKEVKREVSKPKPIEKSVEIGKEIVPDLRFINGVHLDVYEYFRIKPATVLEDTLKRLSFIHEWAFKNKDAGEAMKKISRLDSRLGNRDMGEVKISKIYNYLRVYGNS